MKKLLRLVPLICILVGLNLTAATLNVPGTHATISLAITAAVNGDVILVDDGTYTENLTVNKQVTLQSVNGALTTTINGSINVTSDLVTVDGFTINNPSGKYGIYAAERSDLTIINNILTVGSTSGNGTTYAIGIVCTNTNVSNITISYNTINASGGTGKGSVDGIALGWTDGTATFNNVLIEENTISNTPSASPEWGMYGILVNNATTNGLVIRNNVLENLHGEWTHGIGLEGDTPNAVVEGNTFTNLTANKPYDNYALFFEANPSIGTVSFTDNEINTDGGLGIHSTLLATLTSEKVNAVNNWWGDASGPSGTDLSGSGASFGTDASAASIVAHVTYSPWIGNDPDEPHDEDNPWTFYIDDSNEDALSDVLNSPYLLDGDVVIADGGTYTAVVINSAITLVGTNGATIQNGSPAITVSANNVTIDGFTFAYNTADYAIYLDGDYTGVVVKNCTFNNLDGGGVNPGFGIDNGSANTLGYFVDATDNNAWAGNGFPYNATTSPTGTGVTISQYVQYANIVLVSPVNSVSGVSIKPEFQWELNGADSFTVQIATSSNFASNLLVEHTVSGADSNYRFSGYFHPEIPLNNNTQYYWRVIGKYGAEYDTSGAYYFTTVSDVNISLWNPGDGIQLYQYDPATFTWSLNQATGSLKFYIQLFNQPLAPDYVQIASFELTNAQNLGGNSALYFENISDLTKAITGLSGGSKYYWYVCAYYDDGSTPNVLDLDDRIVKYSALFSFTTAGGAVTAYPSWPVGGYTLYNLEPTFYWYTMTYEPSATYTVLYSTDNTTLGDSLTTGVTHVSAGSNTFVDIGTTLDPSTTYYWQVRTRYNGSYKYSSVASFTTYNAPGLVPTAANLSYPTGGLEIYTTAPTFYWWIGGTGSSVNYEVQLSTDGGTTWPISFGPTTSTYVQGSGLTPGQSYKWRVRSYITGPDEVFSSEGEFSVTGGLSSYPVATWPVGNPTIYSTTPTLSWYFEGSTLGWTHYKVAISKKDWTPAEWLTRITTPDSVVHVTADMNETFYTFTSPLEYGETYYWAVAAHDHPSGPYSDVAEGSFTIAGNYASIVQLNPANNLVINTKSPTFTWWVSGSILGVTHFRVTYSKTELFNAFVETVTTTSTSAAVNAPLEEGTTYWWYVELSYDGGSTWENPSSTWKFTVDPGSSSVVPFAGSPARGITISSTSPVLSWYLPAQSTSALSYDVELADNPEFSNSTVYSDLAALNSKVENLNEGEYFWRVRSKVTSGKESGITGAISDYSAATSFKIGTVTDVDDKEELPLTYSIDQNYPNPFNPTTTINYSIPTSSFVTIRIYDMLGQEVKTLVNQELKAGKHTLNWKGDNNYGYKVASGTYIYRITAGNFVQSKKMVLLK